MPGIYTDPYSDSYGDSGSGGGVLTFNKWEMTRRTTDADPVAWALNRGGNMLMRHYGPQSVGVNVYLMSDGSITENDPTDWSLVDDVLWGGHDTEISAELAARLIDAGYGDWITGVSSGTGYTETYEELYT